LPLGNAGGGFALPDVGLLSELVTAAPLYMPEGL